MISRHAFLAALLVACMPWAHAQWSWRDSNGSRIFSDQPPPSSVPEKDILKRPAAVRAAANTPAPGSESVPTAGTSTTPTGTATTAPRVASKDPELEKRRREAQAKEAASKKAEEEKSAAAKKENCARAKQAKASFDSGVRIGTTNAKGEREIMSDAQRAAESKRLHDIINSDCV